MKWWWLNKKCDGWINKQFANFYCTLNDDQCFLCSFSYSYVLCCCCVYKYINIHSFVALNWPVTAFLFASFRWRVASVSCYWSLCRCSLCCHSACKETWCHQSSRFQPWLLSSTHSSCSRWVVPLSTDSISTPSFRCRNICVCEDICMRK